MTAQLTQLTTVPHLQVQLNLQSSEPVQFLISAQDLLEVLNLNPMMIIPIPHMPVSVIGVCTWQQAVVWLIDLSHFLGLKPEPKLEIFPDRFDVLHVESQSGNLGLFVDQVQVLIMCPIEQIQPMDSEVPLKLSHQSKQFIKQIWKQDTGKILPILDIEAMIQALNADS
ncbi:MAG: chemotaxis protein CheW [Microcoleaceae cyanobacterium]